MNAIWPLICLPEDGKQVLDFIGNHHSSISVIGGPNLLLLRLLEAMFRSKLPFAHDPV